ncbi:hypothetical protein OH807_31460 [Kitasatospora sp. NBC_01560]|uniref:hypothetical protein n=1 Tax=Kitasatospora sp. NBC_01560 TaxID=2975965 RepID=UPI003863B5A8
MSTGASDSTATRPEISEVEAYIRGKFAEHTKIEEAELFTADLTLAAVISRSPAMTNSIDLMEAFARTANAVRKDHGARVRLPALPLDTTTTAVLAEFIAEYRRQTEDAR